LNPGPSSFWAGDRNAAHQPQQKKAADVTRFWLGRSVARRLLGLATRERVGKHIPHRRKQTSVACGKFAHGQGGKAFQQKELDGEI